MTPLATAAGYLTFNGYQFNAASRVKLSAEFVTDRAGRTVVATRYTLRVTTYVAESVVGAGADADILALRQQLSHPGGALSYTGGVGGMDINTGATKDITYGPLPKVLTLEPIANKAVYLLEWQVEVTIPDCADARFTGLMAFNYEVSFSLRGDTGLSVRTYRGYWEIGVTRSGRTVPDTADAYREQVCRILLPPGFRRLSQDFDLSADKRRMEFTVVDEQLAGGLPAGCVDAEGEQAAETTELGAVRFVHTLSARYRLQPGERLSSAYAAFFALYADRLQQAQLLGGGIILTGFRVSRGLYQNDRQVAFRYAYTTTSTLDRILVDSGILRAVPGTDWQQWAISVASVIGPRGPAQLRHLAQEDSIVDLCGGTAALAGRGGNELRAAPDDPQQVVLNTPGWLDYRMKVELTVDPGTVALKTLPTDTTTLATRPNVAALVAAADAEAPNIGQIIRQIVGDRNNPLPALPPVIDPFGDGVGGARLDAVLPPIPAGFAVRPDGADQQPIAKLQNSPTPGGNVAQQRTDPTVYVTLSGYGVRTAFPVPCPALLSFRGDPVVPLNPQRFVGYCAGNLCGIPVFVARWELKFLVLESKRVS